MADAIYMDAPARHIGGHQHLDLTALELFQRARAQGLVRPEVSDEDILRWLVTIALSMFQQGSIEKSPEKELAYLRKVLLPSIFLDA